MKHMSITTLIIAFVLTLSVSINSNACDKNKSTASKDGKACCQAGKTSSTTSNQKMPDGSKAQVINAMDVHAKGSAAQCTMKAGDMKDCPMHTTGDMKDCSMKTTADNKSCPMIGDCCKDKKTASKATYRKKPSGAVKPVTAAGTN